MSAWEGGRVGGEGHLVCSHRSRSFSILGYGEPRGNRTITPGVLGARLGTPSAILFVVPAGPSIPLFPRCHRAAGLRLPSCPARARPGKWRWWGQEGAGGGVPLGEGGSKEEEEEGRRREGWGKRGGRRKELRRDERGGQGPGPKQRGAGGPGGLRHPNCPLPLSLPPSILSFHPPP